MAIVTYRDLDVWKVAMDLCEQVYMMTLDLPTDERFGLATQLKRGSVSIPSNIAEGHGRIHRGEYVHHLSIARGSLMEVETQLALCVRLKLVAREQIVPIWETCQRVGQMLNKLIDSLRES